jgi:hypothetical protein
VHHLTQVPINNQYRSATIVCQLTYICDQYVTSRLPSSQADIKSRTQRSTAMTSLTTPTLSSLPVEVRLIIWNHLIRTAIEKFLQMANLPKELNIYRYHPDRSLCTGDTHSHKIFCNPLTRYLLLNKDFKSEIEACVQDLFKTERLLNVITCCDCAAHRLERDCQLATCTSFRAHNVQVMFREAERLIADIQLRIQARIQSRFDGRMARYRNS